MSENGELRMSRSRSRESEGSRKSDGSYSHSRSPSNEKGSPKSRDSRSKSASKSPYRRSSRHYSGSRSRSRSHSRGRKRSRSRSYHRDRYSRSRSGSRGYHKRSRYSRSRSRGRSPYYRESRESRDYYRESRSSRYRSRSRSPGYSRRRRGKETSPMSNRRRHTGNRDNPEPTKCLGIFGLSLYTQERDLREVFGRFGPLEDVQVVYDRQTGRSRGFAFIHFRNIEDSIEAKDRGPGMEIDGRRIRVDFSITTRAHTPTPGIYLGKPTTSSYRGRRSPSPYSRGGYSRGSRYSRSRSRSRSYSPRFEDRKMKRSLGIFSYEE
ncbi:transformer-2 protein homolog alpha-like isoform X2 [Saccostrea cucullata]|uniref:transformer-2 protein homolog alpha-like isoform X2 n=1 Tax=Saccostrea cuccullata TaxID=36930 RepID=UPI002ED1B798